MATFALLTQRSTSRDTYRSASRSEESRPAASRYDSPSAKAEAPARTATPSSGGSYASYKTPEERAAFIKQQAEQRMAERLAALGIKAPVKAGETPQQRAEREKREREEKLRQAEEEDARREEERQRRLNAHPRSLPRAPARSPHHRPQLLARTRSTLHSTMSSRLMQNRRELRTTSPRRHYETSRKHRKLRRTAWCTYGPLHVMKHH
jgi:hypothetical protein